MAVDQSVKEAYYNDKMKQAVYRKYKEEAESSKILFNDMWSVVGCGINRDQYYSSTTDPDNRKSVYEAIKAKEPKVPSDLESWAVSVEKIDEICNKYTDEFIVPLKKIADTLETSIDTLGSKNLLINNLCFEKKIQELQEALQKEMERMQAFVDAISERAYLTHMIQYYHLVDYYRYYGNYNSFSNEKTWDRESEGI